jgi:fused signal recognition particle receptor
MRLFDRIRDGLARTQRSLGERLAPVLDAAGRLDPGAAWDEASLADIEEALLAADVGVETAEELVRRLGARRRRGLEDPRRALAEVVAESLGPGPRAPFAPPEGVSPWVVLVVGVNGSGKTTLIGKLAARERAAGRSCLVVAADTFRAAATEQLAAWAKRSGAELLGQRPGADPAAVAHDGVSAALARGHRTVLVDTAGRLHTQSNLMDELAKVRRVVARRLAGAPHEVLLVLDGTAGQNALAQARQFHAALGVTALAVNKLDGTARGGAVLAAAREIGAPVRLLGIGEEAGDVVDFEPRDFACALVGVPAEEGEGRG